ncbi:hypothetical protein CAEBREN_01411 [Caenorhabditis brenneri]|uniref:CUB-like domain-containing protein n=1 Tax=Caenorhabditis brenneri TaxID=135651 RepID=G0MQY7_CAEBE|nr:hypothetical protein CAEBREN_01411 [Caenorhabditis brenneri]
MNSFTFTLLFVLLRFSFCSECSTQTVDLNDVVKSFEISSNSSDLEPKKCIYTFTVPKYYVPMVMFVNIQLTGENKITTRQYSEYGGTKSYEITKTTHFNLAPTNFTIEIILKTKTVNDSFSILVSVRDKSPATTGNFFVREDLGTLIDYYDIKGNSSTVQKFDANHSQAQSYTIRVAVFSQDPSLFSLMDIVHVYDNGLYKGSLLDVYTAANNSQICSGTMFEIVNSIDTLVGPLTVLISKTHQGWDETAVLVSSATDTNATQTLSATNGLLVMHEISNPNMGSSLPVYYQQISFRGDTELTIYAGCVTGAQPNRSVAIITPANAHNYENIEIYGRCKTFVLTKGYIQWQSVHNFPKDTYRSEIGRKGVIMNPTFPYPSTDNISHNYLIQSPSADSKENIVVTYEVAFMAPDVEFNIDQDIKAFQDANKTLTASDGTYTSVSTYQEFITYKVSNNSDGFLVRYTVTSSANLINLYFVVLLILSKFV